jgi:DNA-binding NtrC family response regulator
MKRLDTRIIVATNRPLTDLVAQGLFRADLYYRLCGVEIHVPPLRDRREDIEELATYFLARHRQTRDLSMSIPALEALRAYDWPGNVRELERLVESAVALVESDRIELDDLPPRVRGEFAEVLGHSISQGHSMRAWGSRYARLVFERCGRNKRKACRLLDISYHTLQAYLRFAEVESSGSEKQLPAWVKSSSQEELLEEAGA